jgi:hypothetical protein
MSGFSKGMSQQERLDSIKELISKYGGKAAEGAAITLGGGTLLELYHHLANVFDWPNWGEGK